MRQTLSYSQMLTFAEKSVLLSSSLPAIVCPPFTWKFHQQQH